MDNFTSNELSQKINMYLDRSLNEDDQKDLIQRIAQNPEGMAQFNREKNIREKLKERVQRHPVSPGLITRIKNSLGK